MTCLAFIFQHAMLYFFHHYELPKIIQQARFQQILLLRRHGSPAAPNDEPSGGIATPSRTRTVLTNNNVPIATNNTTAQNPTEAVNANNLSATLRNITMRSPFTNWFQHLRHRFPQGEMNAADITIPLHPGAVPFRPINIHAHPRPSLFLSDLLTRRFGRMLAVVNNRGLFQNARIVRPPPEA